MQPYILIDIIHQIVAVIYIIYKSTSENKELGVVLSKYMVKLLLVLHSYPNLLSKCFCLQNYEKYLRYANKKRIKSKI